MKKILTYLFFIVALLQKPNPYLIPEPHWLKVNYKHENYYVEYGIEYYQLIERISLNHVCHQFIPSYRLYHDITLTDREAQLSLSDLTFEQLIQIKGIGEVLGNRIMATLPTLEALSDIDEVKGVGPKLLSILMDSVCF